MTRLLLLLALMCEHVNAAPQERNPVGNSSANGEMTSYPDGAAPFTLLHPLCQTGFMLKQREDTRDRFGIIVKRQWKMTDCVRVPRITWRYK